MYFSTVRLYEFMFVIFSVVEGCDPNQQVVKAKGKTALHAAAAGGYVDIIACLRLVKQIYKNIITVLVYNPDIMNRMADEGTLLRRRANARNVSF